MLLARQYNLFDPVFMAGLSGMDLLLSDNAILNAVIKSDNEAQEKALKKNRDKQDHPGMERFESINDFWDEVESAKAD
jgi:hypothetical protein